MFPDRGAVCLREFWATRAFELEQTLFVADLPCILMYIVQAGKARFVLGHIDVIGGAARLAVYLYT